MPVIMREVYPTPFLMRFLVVRLLDGSVSGRPKETLASAAGKGVASGSSQVAPFFEHPAGLEGLPTRKFPVLGALR